jgi:hypothetical protein
MFVQYLDRFLPAFSTQTQPRRRKVKLQARIPCAESVVQYAHLPLQLTDGHLFGDSIDTDRMTYFGDTMPQDVSFVIRWSAAVGWFILVLALPAAVAGFCARSGEYLKKLLLGNSGGFSMLQAA